jgi:hypothetical protein
MAMQLLQRLALTNFDQAGKKPPALTEQRECNRSSRRGQGNTNGEHGHGRLLCFERPPAAPLRHPSFLQRKIVDLPALSSPKTAWLIV